MAGSDQVRVGIIGYGGAFNMGRQHGQQAEKAGMKVTAICDVDSSRFAEAGKDFPGVETYTDYHEMLAKAPVDLVVAILPHNLHVTASVDCSNAGKHVVVEKPMCITVAEADAMIGAAQKAGKMLSVYHNRRWDGDFLTIKKLIEEGEIGEVFQIELAIGGYSKHQNWWRADKKIAGGALHDWGAHFMDWVFHLVPGKVTSVTGFFRDDVWPEFTIQDHAHAVVRFENGCMVDLQVSNAATVFKDKWRILGTRGGITGNWGDLTVYIDHKGHVAEYKAKPAPGNPDEFYQNINDHLTMGADLIVKPEQARRTIDIIETAERSNASGKSESPVYG